MYIEVLFWVVVNVFRTNNYNSRQNWKYLQAPAWTLHVTFSVCFQALLWYYSTMTVKFYRSRGSSSKIHSILKEIILHTFIFTEKLTFFGRISPTWEISSLKFQGESSLLSFRCFNISLHYLKIFSCTWKGGWEHFSDDKTVLSIAKNAATVWLR